MARTGLLVGLDGSEGGGRALAFAKAQARRMEGCRLILAYVIDWSPFTFQTNEENAERHKRREEELSIAHERILDPAVRNVQSDGLEVEGIVRHGDPAEILEHLALEKEVSQIVIARSGPRGLRDIFGSANGRLVAASSIPVTIVP